MLSAKKCDKKNKNLAEKELLTDEEDEDWQVICEHSLFGNRLHQLEEICFEQYRGISTDFINCYLRPVIELLDMARSNCEEYYSVKAKNIAQPTWSDHFENIVRYAVHPSPLKTSLFKGDFYIHLTFSIPKTLQLKYYCGGKVESRGLSMTDCVLMCSESWTELLRSDTGNELIYSTCIIWTSKGFERVPWGNVLKGAVLGKMEINHKDEDVSLKVKTPSSPAANRDSLNLEEFSSKPMLILDLNFELLHSQVVCIPGSRDKRGGSVIYFDASKERWENAELNSSELTKLLMYYYKIPKETVQHKGSSFVIDAREGKYNREILSCIGEAISMLQIQIPGSVHMAYVMTRKDSLMLLFSTSRIKEKLNFEFQLISSVEKLKREISLDQLPQSYGGHLKYDHEKWIKFRTKVEPFMTGCRSAAKHAMSCMQELGVTDLGYNSGDCKTLLDAHIQKVKDVLEDTRLIGLRVEGKQIIDRITEEEIEQKYSEDYNDTIECVNRLYVQMTRVFDRLQAISDKRTKNLKLCFKVRVFEEQYSELLEWLHNKAYPFLDKHMGVSDSLDNARTLVEEVETFAASYESRLTEAEENLLMGKHLMELDELQVDRDVLREQVTELEDALNKYHLKFSECRKKLNKCFEFHKLVGEVTQWWMSGLTYIAHMNMEEIQTRDGIERLKNSLLHYRQQHQPVSESQHARITELAHHLDSKQVEQAEQTISRSLEVQDMFQIKLNQILGAENRFKKPTLYSVVSDTDGSSSSCKDDDLATEPDEGEYTIQAETDFDKSIIEPLNTSHEIFTWQDAMHPYDENDAKLAVFDVAMPTKMKERLRHIIEEMITTEHDYVKSLEYIIQHYVPEMKKSHLPPTLLGQKNVVFGNIERIYDFHKRFFSQEVESYRHAPLQIGKCFLKWERQFFLYALYNKNKPRSDQLWDDFGNKFFQKKMIELNDKLDLASYLIKPVQRLGKYSLLLKDMINCCNPADPRVIEMNAAHELMKFQLRHGNDLLAMDAIKHCDVNLKEQGCLLRQADFIVSCGKRKRIRRVFLFDHVLVFTKAKKQKAKGDMFVYKHSVKMADLGLTENIGDSGLKFEVWYRRWRKGKKASETYVLQASLESVKTAWTADITRLLWRQATRNKEYGETEASTGISVESTPSAIFLDNDQLVSYNRSRTNDILSPRSTDVPLVNNKRLSWISAGESSNSSGVFDLGSLPEDGNLSISPRDDMNPKVFTRQRDTNDIKYNSLPRKKLTLQNLPTSGFNDVCDILSARRDATNTESHFIRNNVYRKTLQVDNVREKAQKKYIRRGAAISGRYSTQPIVLPSSFFITEGMTSMAMSGTSSLPRASKYKKVISERPASPKLGIRKISEESMNLNPTELQKSTTDTRIDYGRELRSPVKITLRRSVTDINLKLSSQSHSTTFLEQDSNGVSNHNGVRKYSFSKAIIDASAIKVDEREKQKLSRQRSASSGNPLDVRTVSPLDLQKPSMPLSPEKSTNSKRSPFFNIKLKLAKSLSEV